MIVISVELEVNRMMQLSLLLSCLLLFSTKNVLVIVKSSAIIVGTGNTILMVTRLQSGHLIKRRQNHTAFDEVFKRHNQQALMNKTVRIDYNDL